MINAKKIVFKPSNIALIAFGVLFTVLGPLFFTGYSFNVVNVALIYVLCVYGASIITGMGGQMCFALITFMGFGAYYTTNMSLGRWGITFDSTAILLTIPVALGILGFLLGLILFRLKGTFFVLGTLGVLNIAYVFFYNNIPVFGGPTGISGVPALTIGSLKINTNIMWFYFLIFTTVVGYIIVERIRNTKLGRSLASLRDNETAAISLGVNVYMTKVFAFTVSAIFCGFSGAFYVMQAGFVNGDLFTLNSGIRILIMLAMGGIDRTIGAIIGALLVSVLPEVFRGLKDYLNLTYGLAIIALMVFQPSGIAGLGEKIGKLFKKIFGIKSKINASDLFGEVPNDESDTKN